MPLVTSARFVKWSGRRREGEGGDGSPWSEANRALVTRIIVLQIKSHTGSIIFATVRSKTIPPICQISQQIWALLQMARNTLKESTHIPTITVGERMLVRNDRYTAVACVGDRAEHSRKKLFEGEFALSIHKPIKI
ncbi:MAG: hypothetical protein ACREGC_04040 [Minisyncoccia bacterium]